MAETFRCPSCAAPLEFEGKPMQKCSFCSSNVIAPSELFYGHASAAHVDIASLTGRALRLAEIQREIKRGNKINAIKIFRDTFGTGLKEAKDAVEAMERGESVDLTAIEVRPFDLNLRPENVEALKKVGVAFGGSMIAVTALVGLIVIGAFAVGIYFAVAKPSKPITVERPEIVNTVRATPTPTPVPNAEELLKFGGEGTGAGKFKDNRHVAVGPNGEIYSADYHGGRIQVFDASGKFMTQWTAEPGMNLYDMAADRKGNLFIANNKGVMMFEGATGKLLARTTNLYVQGMAMMADGKLAVTANLGFTILDQDLKPVLEIKDAAEAASSTGGFREIAVDGLGNIFALDSTGGDICKFSPQGKFLNRLPSGASSPNHIVIAPSGRIIVSATSTIHVLSETAQPIKSFKSAQAFGMAVNDAGELFVASRPWVIKYKLNI